MSRRPDPFDLLFAPLPGLRRFRGALHYPCPDCGAAPGKLCTLRPGEEGAHGLTLAHAARLEAAGTTGETPDKST